MRNKNKGFTLLEILLVIGIIATLAVVVVVALDPAKRFEDAQNSRRLSDIQSILSAVQQYIVDNKGTFPAGLTTASDEWMLGTANNSLCTSSGGECSVSNETCLNLLSDTNFAKYLKDIPYDPETGSAESTRYSIVVDANNIVTVKACDSTDTEIDSVSR